MESVNDQRHHHFTDRKSRVQMRAPMLRLVEDINHIHPDLLDRVRNAVVDARKKVEGLVANDDGQGMLFPGFSDEIEIPADTADEVIEEAQSHLGGTGLKLEKNGASVKLVRSNERDDPYEELGGR